MERLLMVSLRMVHNRGEIKVLNQLLVMMNAFPTITAVISYLIPKVAEMMKVT